MISTSVSTWSAGLLRTLSSSLRALLPALLPFALLLSGCDQKAGAPAAMPPPAVSVFEVYQKEVGNYREVVARTEASASTSLVARVEGELLEIRFSEGHFVEKDALLMRLDPSEVRASQQQMAADVESQKAQVSAARRDLERGEEVARKGYLSRADLDKLKDKLEQAQAALKAASAQYDRSKISVGYTEIRAPISGRIGKLLYSVGNVVGPASGPLAEIVSIDPIYVNFQINEVDYINYQQRAKDLEPNSPPPFELRIRLPNNEVYSELGDLNFGDTKIDPATGSIALRASFPNPQGIVLPGLYVKVLIDSRHKVAQVVVPQMAVQENQLGKFVLVVSPENSVVQRQVILGRRLGPMWAVAEGLEAGERVIVEGLQKVRPGGNVNPVVKRIDETTGALYALDSGA